MSKPLDRENELELLIEKLIKILGKSNERVNDLSKRVTQLEAIVYDIVLQEYQTLQTNSKTVAFPN